MDNGTESSADNHTSNGAGKVLPLAFVFGLFIVTMVTQLVRCLNVNKTTEDSERTSKLAETPEAGNSELGESVERGHEPAGVNVRKVVMFGIGLFLLGVVIYIALWGLFEYFTPPQANLYRMPPSSLDNTAQFPTEPRIWANPGGSLQETRKAENKILHSYGWVDEERGIVRVPINRAMELLIQRGLPVREKEGGEKNENSRR